MSALVKYDSGWKGVLKEVLDRGGVFVTVGIQDYGDRKEEDAELSNAEIARLNEFGIGVPERSFLRSTFDDNIEYFRKQAASFTAGAVLGKWTPENAMALLGQRVVTKVKRKIRSNIPPGNAESTKARKKSSRTLIDTSQMLNAVDYQTGERKND